MFLSLSLNIPVRVFTRLHRGRNTVTIESAKLVQFIEVQTKSKQYHVICSVYRGRRPEDASQLGVELAQQGHAPSDPVLLGLVRGENHGNHEIGGVARGGQRAPPLTCLIQGSHVARPFGYVRPLTGF